MKKYLLLGYNSGGYKDSEQISFDGKIEKLYKPDPNYSNYPDSPTQLSYFQITHADGTITNEANEFMDKLLLQSRGYHESFLVTQIFEINEESLHVAIKEKNIRAAIKLIEAGVDVNSVDELYKIT